MLLPGLFIYFLQCLLLWEGSLLVCSAFKGGDKGE